MLIKDEYYPIDLSIILDNLLELYSNVVSSFDLKEDTIESDYVKVHKVLLANTMASDSVEEEINGRLKNNEPVLTLEEQDELNDQFYDYYIYAAAAVLIFNTQFFDKSDPGAATLLSLSTLALAFIARPVGSALFGHFGDKLGRKKTLVASLLIVLRKQQTL